MIRLALLTVALLSLSLAVVGAAIHTSAFAWYSPNLMLVERNEDGIRNYDYTTQGAASDNTILDWPWDILFKNNATVQKVKNPYANSGWDSPGGPMNARATDGAGGFWDTDSGVKTWGAHTAHMRVYADADNRMYNISWGYYVFATCHRDYMEGAPWVQWFGKSEEAEGEAISKAVTIWGASNVWPNSASDVSNPESYHVEEGGISGDHIWLNSGRRGTVSVP